MRLANNFLAIIILAIIRNNLALNVRKIKVHGKINGKGQP
jgi:hypothetical protein